MRDNVATVDLQTLTDARLVVGLYDEQGKAMLSAEMIEITPEDTSVSVGFDIETMPEYFLVKAYLLNPETNRPLCKQFECDTYSSVMQEFLSKSIDDFSEDKVLDLDENPENNFMVYNEETVIVKGDEDTNVVTKTDEANKDTLLDVNDVTIIQEYIVKLIPNFDL